MVASGGAEGTEAVTEVSVFVESLDHIAILSPRYTQWLSR
jgi:hypothetical protein